MNQLRQRLAKKMSTNSKRKMKTTTVSSFRHRRAERTCVGCRRSDARNTLLRFVLSGDPPRLTPDLRRRLAGRGASVHPRRSCMALAVKRGAFTRAFRREAPAIAVEDLIRGAAEQYNSLMEHLLIEAWRDKRVAVDIEEARRAVLARTVELLVVASDAVEEWPQFVESGRERCSRLLIFGAEEGLGRLFGRGAIAAAAILDRSVAQRLTSAAECLTALAEEA